MVIVTLYMLYMFFQANNASDRWLESYRGTIYAAQEYRPPNDTEASRFLEDLDTALQGETDFNHLHELGYSAKQGYDKPSGKSYILLENEPHTERAWGAYLIETSQAPQHAITAPHPKSDINSEHIALALWRETPGAIYIVAGTHRRAADRHGDVTRHTDSLFHRVGDHLAERGLSHTQLHGFKDTTSPEEDIIVSSALAPVTDTHHAVVARLRQGTDRIVGTNWDGQVEPMRGRPNQLGKATRSQSTSFIHIEMNHSTRHDAQAIKSVVSAIARGLGD